MNQRELSMCFYRAAAKYMLAGFASQNNLQEDIEDYVKSLGIDPGLSESMKGNYLRIVEGIRIEINSFISDNNHIVVDELLKELLKQSKNS